MQRLLRAQDRRGPDERGGRGEPELLAQPSGRPRPGARHVAVELHAQLVRRARPRARPCDRGRRSRRRRTRRRGGRSAARRAACAAAGPRSPRSARARPRPARAQHGRRSSPRRWSRTCARAGRRPAARRSTRARRANGSTSAVARRPSANHGTPLSRSVRSHGARTARVAHSATSKPWRGRCAARPTANRSPPPERGSSWSSSISTRGRPAAIMPARGVRSPSSAVPSPSNSHSSLLSWSEAKKSATRARSAPARRARAHVSMKASPLPRELARGAPRRQQPRASAGCRTAPARAPRAPPAPGGRSCGRPVVGRR